ncbi:MAG: RDD family protein [Anaerolineales bacterium]|nr:RDD family protein [Anaerolineales bacterium]
MDFDSALQVNTPENVALEYPLAGIGSRFLASLADHLLLAGILLVVNTVVAFAVFLAFRESAVDNGEIPNWIYWAFAALGLVSFAVQHGYFIFFEILWNGQTPGKRALRLRVVRSTGLPISAAEAVIRNVVRIIDSMPLGYGVGLVSMFLDPHCRRLGDFAAGTLVVCEHAGVTLASLFPVREKTFGGAPPAGFPLERLSDDEKILIADFLARRDSMANRKDLAAVLLEGICRRLDRVLPDNEKADPEAVLEGMSRALKDKQ